MDKNTGLVSEGKLNQVEYLSTKRKNGTTRRQTDFANCPTMAEQHTAHLSDVNYLMTKLKPDELASYIAARSLYKQEIVGHDFSKEPNLQEARNITYKLKKAFEELPDEIKNNFKNHVEFLKFIDNPLNQDKMIKMGLLTKKEIQKHTDPLQTNEQNDKNKTGPDNKNTKTTEDPNTIQQKK